MAPKIKLQRVGAKNKAKFRIVIQEERSKLNGQAIEILGHYDPHMEPSIFEFKKERMELWLKNGAQPTEKVRYLLGKAGLLPPVDFTNRTKRKPKSAEGGEAAAVPTSQEAKKEQTEEA